MFNSNLFKTQLSKRMIFILSLVIGSLCFLLLYGTTPLHVTNDNWIMAAIDEDDIIQHYAGWTMFRAGEWAFPIGLIKNMAAGTGTVLSYTDSIPVVAILFKALFGIVGYDGKFQYFGWFTLLCFVLQAYAAGLLVKRKTTNIMFVTFSMVLFCFAPPLLDRTLRHTALGAQFLVLFSMLLYFKQRDEKYTKMHPGYCILAFLAVGIHPYFLPMVMIFCLLSTVEGCVFTKKYKIWIGQFIFACASAILTGKVLGVFESSGDVERDGYGHYTMNLLAPFNPEGGVGYKWSRFLPTLGMTNGNYEGFNYLGLGMIILIAVLVIYKILMVIKKKDRLLEKRHLGYLIIMIFMTMFAVSNVVTIGHKELFSVPMPSFLIDLCGIFRSSGRMFYPVFYSIYLLALYRLYDLIENNIYIPVAVICFLTLVQLGDFSEVVKQKHERMSQAAFYQSILDDVSVNRLAKGCDKIVATRKYRDLCVFAGLHDMTTSFSAATGGTWDKAYLIRDQYVGDLEKGRHDGKTMFVTDSWTQATDWVSANSDLEMYQYNDDEYIVAPVR